MIDTLVQTQRLVRTAARGLARTGLVHAYGHCSQRLDQDRFLVCAARPMGLIAAGEDGTVIHIDEPLPAGVLGEVRLHQQIYRRRPEVGGIVRSMPPALMALGTARRTPEARHGMGAYFGTGAALWDDPQLVRDDERAAAVAETLARGVAVGMRGNGAVVAADSQVKATVLTWYLEDAARLELQVRAAGLAAESVVLSAAERQTRATDSGAIFERMWQFITAGDIESQN